MAPKPALMECTWNMTLSVPLEAETAELQFSHTLTYMISDCNVKR